MLAFIIVNYNNYQETIKAVNSLYENNDIDFIVVVDNASTDDSYHYLKNIEGGKTIVLDSGRNGGYSWGNNCGIRYALDNYKPDFIAIMNPDVELPQKSLTNCLKILNGNPSIGVITPIMYNSNGERNAMFAWKERKYLHDLVSTSSIFTKFFYNSRILKSIYYSFDDFIGCEYGAVDTIPGSLLIFRTDALRSTGLFDEKIFLYYEEEIICRKLRNKGYQVAIDPNHHYVHHHATTINKNVDKIGRLRLLCSSKYYYWKEHREISRLQLAILKASLNLNIAEQMIITPTKNLIKKLKGSRP